MIYSMLIYTHFYHRVASFPPIKNILSVQKCRRPVGKGKVFSHVKMHSASPQFTILSENTFSHVILYTVLVGDRSGLQTSQQQPNPSTVDHCCWEESEENLPKKCA